jgi:hypothetical protein
MNDKEFKEAIYSLAFGEGACESPVPYEPEEVVERIEKYTNASFLDEDLEREVDEAIKTIWGELFSVSDINTIIKALNKFHTNSNDNGETDAFKYY